MSAFVACGGFGASEIGAPLQIHSAMYSSAVAITMYIWPRLAVGVGKYVVSALSASRALVRVRYRSRTIGVQFALLSWTWRWSVSLRWEKVSLDFHSSVMRPANIHGLSPAPEPAVIWRSRLN